MTLASRPPAHPRKRAALALLLAVGIAGLFLLLNSSSNHPGDDPAAGSAHGAPGRHGRGRPGALPAAGASGDPASAEPGGEEAKGRPLFFSPWGSAPDQLGRDRPDEGNPLGPMSLAMDGKGRTYILDEVNGRIVRRGPDGKPDGTIRVDLIDAQDMAVGPDGTAAVLDRFVDKTVALYDEAGVLRGELPIEGEGVDDVGTVTGVFVDGTDVYVEREHGPLVKIGDTSGLAAEPRSEIPGRPSRDGLSFISAGIIESEAGRVYVASIERATNQHRFTRELRLKTQVHSIVLLDTDKTGTIYFAAQIELPDGQIQILLTCMEPLKGVPVGSAILPDNTLPEESFRDYVVLDDGGVLQALRTEQGVTYVRYDCE